MRTILLIVFLCACVAGQPADPAYAPLAQAYQALKLQDYAKAVDAFEQAIALAPDRPAIHKDLAYTLLKIGENESARDHFAAALKLDPSDRHVALEYAFLCYETKMQAEARLVFDRVRKTGDATAEQAFQNIDRPLAEGIARWTEALRQAPENFSAHLELARLSEQRGELEAAAQHYREAFRLKPSERELLLDIGRVAKAQGNAEEAMVALLAASRGLQPRVAESARELLPTRYPYVYEFQQALELDPKNVELRRELAYLHLEMSNPRDAESLFLWILEREPNDLWSAAQVGFLRLNRNDRTGAQPLLDRVLKGDDDELADRVRVALRMPQTLRRRGDVSRSRISNEARALAEKSIAAGYMKDALKYLRIAHETDPLDFWVINKLGWANNVANRDAEAIEWFKMARKSDDPTIAAEATQSYNNLRPGLSRFRTTAWAFPFFSSRWKDAFGYGQVKTDYKIDGLPFRPYISMRIVGDLKQSTGPSANPQYLSESSFIFGVGVASNTWRHATAWFEAGEAVKYIPNRKDIGAAIPDYRGGISFAKGFGRLLGGAKGYFAETNDDGVFVSRFGDDFLAYTQNRLGYTFAPSESPGGVQAQIYWNANATQDSNRQYWANFVETGPGVRFKLNALPKSMLFSVNFIRGAYTVNEHNPRRPNYYDLRAGFWYAFVH